MSTPCRRENRLTLKELNIDQIIYFSDDVGIIPLKIINKDKYSITVSYTKRGEYEESKIRYMNIIFWDSCFRNQEELKAYDKTINILG